MSILIRPPLYIKKLTFSDYFAGEAKKSGVTDSTYRQVMLSAKKNNLTEKEQLDKMVNRL